MGVTGLFASGKTTVAKLLARRLGAAEYSLSDEVRVEARKRGLALTVANLSGLANELRRSRGPGVWAERVISRARGSGREWVVAESVRSPAEVSVLRGRFGGNFFLVAVRAPAALRFARYRRTPRGREFRSLADFMAAERKQMRGGKKSQALAETAALADFSITNSGTRKRLEGKVAALALRLRRAAGGPGACSSASR